MEREDDRMEWKRVNEQEKQEENKKLVGIINRKQRRRTRITRDQREVQKQEIKKGEDDCVETCWEERYGERGAGESDRPDMKEK